MYLDSLPPELYSAIFAHLPVNDVQQAALALTRAIPYAPIPQFHLFEHGVRLRTPRQIVKLHSRLRGAPNDVRWVTQLRLETWEVDAEVVINLLRLLGSITSMTLFIGPDFHPEHLKKIFHNPRKELRYISLRFRP